MHARRPIPTCPVLSIRGLLLVRQRGHRQEHSRYLRQGRPTQLLGEHNSTNEGLPGAEEARVPARAEGIPAAAGSQTHKYGVRR